MFGGGGVGFLNKKVSQILATNNFFTWVRYLRAVVYGGAVPPLVPLVGVQSHSLGLGVSISPSLHSSV